MLGEVPLGLVKLWETAGIRAAVGTVSTVLPLAKTRGLASGVLRLVNLREQVHKQSLLGRARGLWVGKVRRSVLALEQTGSILWQQVSVMWIVLT